MGGDKWAESLALGCWGAGEGVVVGVLDTGVLFLER